jgi:hypothetical protein
VIRIKKKIMKWRNIIHPLPIVDTNKKWIYESPDKGKTLYRRPFGKTGPKELIMCNLPVSLN